MPSLYQGWHNSWGAWREDGETESWRRHRILCHPRWASCKKAEDTGFCGHLAPSLFSVYGRAGLTGRRGWNGAKPWLLTCLSAYQRLVPTSGVWPCQESGMRTASHLWASTVRCCSETWLPWNVICHVWSIGSFSMTRSFPPQQLWSSAVALPSQGEAKRL